jgi:hypothetical protein
VSGPICHFRPPRICLPATAAIRHCWTTGRLLGVTLRAPSSLRQEQDPPDEAESEARWAGRGQVHLPTTARESPTSMQRFVVRDRSVRSPQQSEPNDGIDGASSAIRSRIAVFEGQPPARICMRRGTSLSGRVSAVGLHHLAVGAWWSSRWPGMAAGRGSTDSGAPSGRSPRHVRMW